MVRSEIECYKHTWILQETRNAVNTISSRVVNTDRVESRVMNHVGQYLLADTRNINNKRYIKRLIYQEIQFALKRLKREIATHFEDLTTNDEEGQAIEYEPVDVLANVESELMVKETIILLAKDDRRKEFILNAWANGYTDDTEVSHILADVFTGQATGHLSFIKRFRKTCRAELVAQAI